MVKGFYNNENPLILSWRAEEGNTRLLFAAAFPDKNYLGVDIKGARIWAGARMAMEQGLANAGFLRTRIEQIGLFMGEKRRWMKYGSPFPDPFC